MSGISSPEIASQPASGLRKSRRTFRKRQISPGLISLALATLLLLLFVTLPLLALLLRVLSVNDLIGYLGRPVVRQGLQLSAITSLISLVLAVALGTPAAYLLARYRFPGRRVLDTLIDLPIVLPPSVAGIALLMAFGRRGLLGGALDSLGISIVFTAAAVVMAQTFVAFPFYVRAARAGFQGLTRDYEEVSATLGVSNLRTFWRITVPLVRPALLSGAVMTWARALGEFGATIMFAGNFIGRTQTMPLAIYSALESDLNAALVLALILVVFSFAVLLTFKLLAREHNW